MPVPLWSPRQTTLLQFGFWIDGWMGSVPGPRSSRDGQTGGGAMFVECINDRRFPCTFHRDEHSFARHRQLAGFADLCQVNTLQSRNKSISSSSQNQKMQQPARLRGKLFITCENNSLLIECEQCNLCFGPYYIFRGQSPVSCILDLLRHSPQILGNYNSHRSALECSPIKGLNRTGPCGR